jgi:hypothetical protein
VTAAARERLPFEVQRKDASEVPSLRRPGAQPRGRLATPAPAGQRGGREEGWKAALNHFALMFEDRLLPTAGR